MKLITVGLIVSKGLIDQFVDFIIGKTFSKDSMRYNCFSFNRNLTLGASALTYYCHACQHQSEPKSRKYLDWTIWMLTYDDEKVIYTLPSC